jgi:hypothetical protein
MPLSEGARTDQAAGLRRLVAARATGMLALTGAEPAGFAPLALELASDLGGRGHRVLLLDLTRATLARRLGWPTRYELMHVVDSCKRLEDVLVPGPSEIPLLPAVRGVRALAGAWRGRARFADFIDRAGASPQLVIAVVPTEELRALAQLAAFETLVIVNREGGAYLKASYAALKRAHAAHGAVPRLVYRDGLGAAAARRAHDRLIETSRTFLGGEPVLVGRLGAASAPSGPGDIPPLTLAELSNEILHWTLPRMRGGSPVGRAAHAAKLVSL